jgi:2,4-diaminopentanoate dehydrogenase
MSKVGYRVIQWATGTVGMAALRHFIENPEIELAGVWVTHPDKIGKDAGDIAGLPKTGVIATNDGEELIALDADCVHMAQLSRDNDLVCRFLRSGKNVICALGPYYEIDRYAEDFAKIEAACQDGGASFFGSGVHPGFAGDLLPLTMARLMNRIDHIEVSEIIDKVRNPMIYIEVMGFGDDFDELSAKPKRSPEAPHHFSMCMAMVIEALGKKMEKLTSRLELARATEDIPYYNGTIRKGTVGGQHYEWTAWVEGKPFMTYHFYWTMGENVEPRWEVEECKYRIRMAGDPPLEMHLMGGKEDDGRHPFHGLPWTGLLGATAVPAVCDARVGIVNHFDLGVVKPRGLVRPA